MLERLRNAPWWVRAFVSGVPLAAFIWLVTAGEGGRRTSPGAISGVVGGRLLAGYLALTDPALFWLGAVLLAGMLAARAVSLRRLRRRVALLEESTL